MFTLTLRLLMTDILAKLPELIKTVECGFNTYHKLTLFTIIMKSIFIFTEDKISLKFFSCHCSLSIYFSVYYINKHHKGILRLTL